MRGSVCDAFAVGLSLVARGGKGWVWVIIRVVRLVWCGIRGRGSCTRFSFACGAVGCRKTLP